MSAPSVTLLTAAMGVFSATAADVSPRPNIVKFIIDDLGYADMSFLAEAPDDVKNLGTPNIDRLRAMGTYFTNAYATCPVCSPARTGMITGRYQQRWGNYWFGQGGLPLNEKTLPQMLKEVGYATKKVGKCHHNGGPAEFPTKHGFDEFIGFMHHTWDYMRLSENDVKAYGESAAEAACIGPLVYGEVGADKREKRSYENGFTTEIFTEEALNYLNRDHKGTPFYLQLDYNAMHHPTYVVPPKYAKRIGLVTAEWDRNAEKKFPFWDPEKEGWNKWHEKWGHLGAVDPDGRTRYLAHLLALDECIGKVLKSLETKGLLKNTILVFTSDNGGTINTYANNGKLRGYKYMFGEGGIRVPLIIAAPGRVPAGKTLDPMVSCMDIMPTLLDLCNGTIPNNLDGKTLVPLLTDKSGQSPHSHLCWGNGRKAKAKEAKAVRQGDYKLVINGEWDHLNFTLENGKAVRAANDTYPGGTCLFDLKKDIGETTNIAEQMPEKVKAMTALFDTWRSDMQDPKRAK